MELVYLWVEEYKNIEKQGFSFSSKFTCFYNESNKELTLNKNDDNLDSFFGQNINVTALVGRNGSGKSSIFELISSLILNNEIENKISFSIFDGTKIICFTNITNLSLKNHPHTIENLVHISNYDLFSVYYSSNFTNGSLNSILELFTTPFFRTHYQTDSSYKSHGYKNDHLKVQSLLNLLFNSSRVLDFHPTSSVYRNQHSFTIKEQQENYEISKVVIILQFLKHFRKDYLPVNIHEDDDITINIQHNKYTSKVHQKLFIDKVNDLIQLTTKFYDEDTEKTYYKAVNQAEYTKAQTKLISFLNARISDLEAYKSFSLSVIDSITFIDLYIDLYRFNRNLLDSLFDFKFKNLSSGEENLILMFALIERGISSFVDHHLKNNQYNFILMFDEIENNFNPNWQKQLFYRIIEFLTIITNHWKNEYSKEINFSILLASHSPFIVSDLPKEQIIFLENGKQKTLTIDTFGANIHTLLAHKIFMGDSLMGQYAKEKINTIIKNLNNNTYNPSPIEKKQVLYTINMIGEEFLKTKLLDMFYKKFNDDFIKKQRKQELEKQQRKIQQELDNL